MAKKKTTKAVAKKEETLVEGNLSSHNLAQLADYDMTSLEGVALDVTDEGALFKNDIIVPKLWLIQAMSELRKDKKADEGDYADSRSEEVLLKDAEEFLPIVVMKTFKRWQLFEKVGDKKEYVSSEIMTLENANQPYEFSEDGKDFMRRQVISAYVLLGDDAQKGIVKPYIIDFASTSKGAGRDMVSDIKVLNTEKRDPRTGELQRRGLPSWVGWFKLGSYETNYNGHDFHAKSMKFGGLLPQDMFAFLREAYDEITSLIDSNSIEIDDRDLHDKPQSSETGKVNAPDATEAGV